MIASTSSDFLVNFGALVAAGVVIAALGVAWKWADRHLAQPLQAVPNIVERQERMDIRQARMDQNLTDVVDQMATLLPNGGSSLRDSIDRNERMTTDILDCVKPPTKVAVKKAPARKKAAPRNGAS